MVDVIEETKKLKLNLVENEEDFKSGQRKLNETLERTEELYNIAISSNKITANKILQDSTLLGLQTKYTRDIARAFNALSLVFNPREFSIKVRSRFCPRVDGEENATKRAEPIHKLWYKLGGHSKDIMFAVPNFSFLYGTFDATPIEPVKKKRKQTVKDKIGEQTKPEKVNLNASSKQQDVMLANAERILSIFQKLVKKSENGALYFYDFVTDPQSFTRTIENIFLVSLLVKERYLCIFSDEQKLPCLRYIKDNEKANWEKEKGQQAIISLTMEEWQNIVETFDFKTPQIPPKQSQAENSD